MPLFTLYCVDRPGARDAQAASREAHLAHVRTPGVTRFAGPLIGEAGTAVGSLIVVEAADAAAARAFADADPFGRDGVYARVDIHEFRMTYQAP